MSKRGQYLRDTYFGRYIGVESPVDGKCIKSIEQLDDMLEQDYAYVLLQHVNLDWYTEAFPEWCIIKVYSNKENLNNYCNEHNIKTNDLSERVKKTDQIKNIHFEPY